MDRFAHSNLSSSTTTHTSFPTSRKATRLTDLVYMKDEIVTVVNSIKKQLIAPELSV